MYNKLFSKILDSSIWLETDSTRIVWMTLLAAMDEDGFAPFAAVANLANRARVSVEQCQVAVKVLESPDANSSDPDNAGRRIERVPGGWLVLNAGKYQEIFNRSIAREKTRQRVARHRASKKGVTLQALPNVTVTPGNAPVTLRNESVMQSETYSESDKQAPAPEPRPAKPGASESILFLKLSALEGGTGGQGSAGQLTKPAQARVRVALAAILAVCPRLTPRELDERIARYPAVMPKDCRITANALAANWAKCAPKEGQGGGGKARPPEGPPGWFDWFEAEFAKLRDDAPGFGQLAAAHQNRAFHMLPGSWQKRAFANAGRQKTG